MFFGLCVFNLSESASLLAARIEWSFVGRVESFSEVEGFDGPQFFGVELGDPVSGRFVWYEEWAGRVDGNPSFAEVYAGDQSFTVIGGDVVDLWILDYDQEMGIAATFDAPEPRVWVSLADFETGVYVFFASDLDAVVVRELPDVEVEREPTGELAMLRFEPSRLRSGGCGALDVPVLLSSTCEAQGLSFAVTHDAALMRPLGARSAGIAMELRDGAGPEFLSVSLEADVDDCPLVSGGMAVSMVTAFEGIGGAALPPATSEPVLVLEYEILSAAAVGSRVQLRPRDCLRASATSEPAHLVLTCGGRTVVLATAPAVVEIVEACFTRGDCNADGSFDIVDPISLLLFLFHDIGGSGPIDCADACDTNDDGAADISDAIASLVRLFQGGPAPPNPYRDCGLDATSDDLFCRAHACSSGAPR